MATVSLDEILKMAEQLPITDQNKLIYQLRVKQAVKPAQTPEMTSDDRIIDEWYAERGSEYVEHYRNPTREELIDELHQLRAAGVFENVESLYGKYANPNVPEMTAEEFHAELHAIVTEWEQELDDLDSSDS